MKSIQEDIKNGQFKKVYLLFGEEDYLKKQYRDKLKKALWNADDTMNYHYYEGKNIAAGEIIDLAETMPFFADRRLILIENSGFFKHGGEQLADYIPSIPETAALLFVESDIDKRSRLFKAVKDTGRAVEFLTPSEQDLKKWILGILQKEKKNLTEDTLNCFLTKTGTEMENIKSELEKLVCYTLDKNIITMDDVEKICTTKVTNHIFDMINAIADKKQKQALEQYYDLLSLKEPPLRILFLIARQFNMLLQVKELKLKGYDNRIISEKMSLQSFIVGKYINQSAKFSKGDLKKAVSACVDAEESVKTGKIADILSVELLIVEYSL